MSKRQPTSQGMPSDLISGPAGGAGTAEISLYCVHGSAIVPEDGTRAELRAGYDNDVRHLEVKAELQFTVLDKQEGMPLCLFRTSLGPDEHCSGELLASGTRWRRPLELVHGKLTEIP